MSAAAMGLDDLQHGAGVISAIRHDIAGAGMESQQPCHRRLVRGLPGRQRDGDGQAAPVHHRVDLGAQSATRTTKGVIGPPFFAAAC